MNIKILLGLYLGLFLLTVVMMTDLERERSHQQSTINQSVDLPEEQLRMVSAAKLYENVAMAGARHQAILDIEYLQRLYAQATDLLGLTDPASISRGTSIYQNIFSQDLQASFYGSGINTIRKSGINDWLELVTSSLGPMGPTQHLIGTQVVDITELKIDDAGNILKGEAMMKSYLQAWHTLPDQKVWLALGTYYSKVRFSDGKWKIWQMDLELTVDETRQFSD